MYMHTCTYCIMYGGELLWFSQISYSYRKTFPVKFIEPRMFSCEFHQDIITESFPPRMICIIQKCLEKGKHFYKYSLCDSCCTCIVLIGMLLHVQIFEHLIRVHMYVCTPFRNSVYICHSQPALTQNFVCTF